MIVVKLPTDVERREGERGEGGILAKNLKALGTWCGGWGRIFADNFLPLVTYEGAVARAKYRDPLDGVEHREF